MRRYRRVERRVHRLHAETRRESRLCRRRGTNPAERKPFEKQKSRICKILSRSNLIYLFQYVPPILTLNLESISYYLCKHILYRTHAHHIHLYNKIYMVNLSYIRYNYYSLDCFYMYYLLLPLNPPLPR